MRAYKQSGTRPLHFLMVLNTDHITGATGLTPTVTLSKDGAAFAAPAGAVTEIGSGWYQVAGNATDSNTLGSLILHATATGADVVDDRYQVVAYDPEDAAALGLSRVDVAVSSRSAPATAQTIDQTTAIPASPGAGTIGEALKFADTRIDTAVSSRMATFSLPTNFAAMAITAGGLVSITQGDADKVWSTTTRLLTGNAGIKKNTALSNFVFQMTDSTNHAPAPGLTVTAQRRLDGAALGPCVNAVTELSNGDYAINLAAGDLNGNTVQLVFTAPGGDRLAITIVTNP